MQNPALNNVEQQVTGFGWKKCWKCQEEWTSISLNYLGYCPECHVEEMGDSGSGRLFGKVIRDYWHEHRDWNGDINTLPKDMKKRIYEFFVFKERQVKSLKDEIE